jgi:hypothetical protein
MKIRCSCGQVMGDMTMTEPHIHCLIKYTDISDLYDLADEGKIKHGDDIHDYLISKMRTLWQCLNCRRILEFSEEGLKFYNLENPTLKSVNEL